MCNHMLLTRAKSKFATQMANIHTSQNGRSLKEDYLLRWEWT